MQLSCCQQTRALTLLDCGKTQQEVAEDLGVSVSTISRLSVKARRQNVKKAEAPKRKVGSGRRPTYGKKQVNAIEKLIDEDPDVTCHQVKLRLPKLLKGVGRRTIQRVILQKLDEGLGIPSLVSAEVPFWTEDLRKRRLSWCRKYKRLTRQDWV